MVVFVMLCSSVSVYDFFVSHDIISASSVANNKYFNAYFIAMEMRKYAVPSFFSQ